MNKSNTSSSRRRFMLMLTALTGGLFAAGKTRTKHLQQDTPLKEADFYRPHNRAG